MKWNDFVDAILGTASTTAMIFLILLGASIFNAFLGFSQLPIFWPIIAGLEFPVQGEDLKLWFGIITLIVVEVGLITPPVGPNVFVINSMAKDVPMIDTFKGVLPFFLSDVVRVIFIILFPTIVLILPRLLEG